MLDLETCKLYNQKEVSVNLINIHWPNRVLSFIVIILILPIRQFLEMIMLNQYNINLMVIIRFLGHGQLMDLLLMHILTYYLVIL